MDIQTQLAREALLHFRGSELIAVTFDGELHMTRPANQADREDFYQVNIAKTV